MSRKGLPPKKRATPITPKAQQVIAEAAAVRRVEMQMAAENVARIKGVVEMSLVAGAEVLRENFDFSPEQAADWMKLVVPRLNQVNSQIQAKRPPQPKGK